VSEPAPSAFGREAVGGAVPVGPYSPGIVAEGRLLFVSGQIAAREGEFVGGSFAEQAELALENLEAVLDAAGASIEQVVRCGVFLADIANGPEFNRIYAARFPEPRPARSTIEAKLPLGALVEIDCVAVLPAG
jgi:2-iminobutanoate/2-iminopropanoate deaminase